MTNKLFPDQIIFNMMSYLVKHPKNPNGIEIDKLNKMSDEEIEDAFWATDRGKSVRHEAQEEANHDK